MSEIQDMLTDECKRILLELKNCQDEATANQLTTRLSTVYQMMQQEDQARATTANRYVQIADIAVRFLTTALTVGAAGVCFAAGLKFEETGSFSSRAASNVMSMLRMFKNP